jgi:hypothetical protein
LQNVDFHNLIFLNNRRHGTEWLWCLLHICRLQFRLNYAVVVVIVVETDTRSISKALLLGEHKPFRAPIAFAFGADFPLPHTPLANFTWAWAFTFRSLRESFAHRTQGIRGCSLIFQTNVPVVVVAFAGKLAWAEVFATVIVQHRIKTATKTCPQLLELVVVAQVAVCVALARWASNRGLCLKA